MQMFDDLIDHKTIDICKLTTFDDCVVGKERLKGHHKMHVNEEPYHCDFCGYVCIAKNDLIEHMKGHFN